MAYELSILKLNRRRQNLSMPIALDQVEQNPLAGAFTELECARLVKAISQFPFARPVAGVRNCFAIEAPGGGLLEAWMTSDGHLFLESQAGLELTLALFFTLRQACPDLAIEDPQRGLVHDGASFISWLEALTGPAVAA